MTNWTLNNPLDIAPMNRTSFFHLLPAALAACLVCGCSGSDAPYAPEASVPLTISVSTCDASPASRAIINEAAGLGKIGVFLTAEDGYSPYAIPDLCSAVFALSGGTWNASRTVNLQSRSARLYAWYPVVTNSEESTGSGTTRTVPVSISASQTFDGATKAGCSQTDYMYGSANGTPGDAAAIIVNRDRNNPTINMQHALSQVVFTIEYKPTRLPDAEYDYVKQISLQSQGNDFFDGTGTMQLNDGTLALLTATNTLTFTTDAGTAQLPGEAGKPAAVAYGLVAPKAATSGNVTVSLVLGQKNSADNDLTLTATTSTWFSAAWEKGVRYTYHLLLDKNDLTFESVEIGKWTPNGQGNTEVPPVLE